MKAESKLLSTEEFVKKFVNAGDAISFGGSAAIGFETYGKKIKGNLGSCVRGG